jgi:hypothetical protein
MACTNQIFLYRKIEARNKIAKQKAAGHKPCTLAL